MPDDPESVRHFSFFADRMHISDFARYDKLQAFYLAQLLVDE